MLQREVRRRAAARALIGNCGKVPEVTDRDCTSAWMKKGKVHLHTNVEAYKGVERARRMIPVTHDASTRAVSAGTTTKYERLFTEAAVKWAKAQRKRVLDRRSAFKGSWQGILGV